MLIIILLFIYYAPVLMIGSLHFSIYINGLVIGSSSLVAFPFAFYLVAKVNRRTVSVACLTVILVSAFVMSFYWHPKSHEVKQPLAENVGVLIGFFLIGVATAIEYSFIEVYLL